jgi:hypothetical protein
MCRKARQSCDDLLHYDHVVEIHDKIHQLFAYYVLSLKYMRSMPSIRHENVFLPTTLPTVKSQCCLCLITYTLCRKQVLQNKIPNFPDAYILLITVSYYILRKPFLRQTVLRTKFHMSFMYLHLHLTNTNQNPICSTDFY